MLNLLLVLILCISWITYAMLPCWSHNVHVNMYLMCSCSYKLSTRCVFVWAITLAVRYMRTIHWMWTSRSHTIFIPKWIRPVVFRHDIFFLNTLFYCLHWDTSHTRTFTLSVYVKATIYINLRAKSMKMWIRSCEFKLRVSFFFPTLLLSCLLLYSVHIHPLIYDIFKQITMFRQTIST